MEAALVEAALVKAALVKAALVKAALVKVALVDRNATVLVAVLVLHSWNARRRRWRGGGGESMWGPWAWQPPRRVQKADTGEEVRSFLQRQILATEGWSTFPTSRLYCSFQRSTVPPLSGRFLACEGQRGGAISAQNQKLGSQHPGAGQGPIGWG